MEYEGYLQVLPAAELQRQHKIAETAEVEYRKTKEDIAQELARRGLGECVLPEVVED